MTQIPGPLTPRVAAAVIDQILDPGPIAAPAGSAYAFWHLHEVIEKLGTRLAAQVHFQASAPGSATPGALRALSTGRLRVQAALDSLVAVQRLVRDDDRHADAIAARLTPIRAHLAETAAGLVRDAEEAAEEAVTAPSPLTLSAPIGREAVRVAEDAARRLSVVLREFPRPGVGQDGQLGLAQEASGILSVATALAGHSGYHAIPADPAQVEAYAAFSTVLGHLGRAVTGLGDAAVHQAALARPNAGYAHVARARLDDSLDDAYVALQHAVAHLRVLADATTVGGTSPTIAQMKNASRNSGVPTQRRRR